MRGRAGEIDQIAFEIVRSGLRALFLFGHATSDRLFLSFFSERIRQAGASPVLSNAESETDASSEEDDSESSPSSEVSVSEEESEVEFSPEAAEVISIPPFRMESREREHQILLKAEYLLSRGEVDDEYVHDIHRNLKETADLGEWAYRPHLDFEEFEVGLMGKKLEMKDRLFLLFSNDPDPEVINFRTEERTVASLTYRLNDDFQDFYKEITNHIETTYSHDQGFREGARDHVNFFINDLRTHGHESITYIQFREEVINKTKE